MDFPPLKHKANPERLSNSFDYFSYTPGGVLAGQFPCLPTALSVTCHLSLDSRPGKCTTPPIFHQSESLIVASSRFLELENC